LPAGKNPFGPAIAFITLDPITAFAQHYSKTQGSLSMIIGGFNILLIKK
jgi:hypothetical protein